MNQKTNTFRGGYRTRLQLKADSSGRETAVDLNQQVRETIHQNRQMLTKQQMHEEEYNIVTSNVHLVDLGRRSN